MGEGGSGQGLGREGGYSGRLKRLRCRRRARGGGGNMGEYMGVPE